MIGKHGLDGVKAVQIEAEKRDLLERHAEEAGHHADYLSRIRKHFLMEVYLLLEL